MLFCVFSSFLDCCCCMVLLLLARCSLLNLCWFHPMSISRSRLTVDHCFGSVVSLFSYVAVFVLRCRVMLCTALSLSLSLSLSQPPFSSHSASLFRIFFLPFLHYRSHILTFILFSFIINDNLQKKNSLICEQRQNAPECATLHHCQHHQCHEQCRIHINMKIRYKNKERIEMKRNE